MGQQTGSTTRLVARHLANIASSLSDNNLAPPPLIPENVLLRLSKISKLRFTHCASQLTPSRPIAADTLCSGPLQDCSIHIPLNYPGRDSTQYSGCSSSMETTATASTGGILEATIQTLGATSIKGKFGYLKANWPAFHPSSSKNNSSRG